MALCQLIMCLIIGFTLLPSFQIHYKPLYSLQHMLFKIAYQYALHTADAQQILIELNSFAWSF